VADAFFPENVEKVVGAATATMGTALFHIRATIFDPISKAEIPVPAHFFELVHTPPGGGTSSAVARSTVSNAVAGPPPSASVPPPSTSTPPPLPTGVCALGDPKSFPPGSYSLLLLPADNTIRAAYLRDQEAWIDLDQQVFAAAPPTSSPPGKLTPAVSAATPIDRRKLLRIPIWSSVRKASTGGFKVSPPSASFASSGVLSEAEMVPFGTPDKPWEIVLDFKWVRAKVKYLFFDWQQDKEQTLPPGLVVEAFREARPSPNRARVADKPAVKVGAGTAISATDGTVYLLLEGDKSLWQAVQLQFTAAGRSFVDLSSKATPNPDTRLSNGTLPSNADDRNILPPVWASHTMRTSFVTVATTTPKPDAPWEKARIDLANDGRGDDATVTFHLDDVVLGDGAGVPIAIPDSPAPKPPTLFDHFLTIRLPRTDAPYQSNLTMVGLVIPAAQAYTVGTRPAGTRAAKPLEISTRLIHFEGRFHDLRDDTRVRGGAPGSTLCLGARVAVLSAHPFTTVQNPLPSSRNKDGSTKLGVQLHFIDVPGVRDPRSGAELQHMLVYLSFEIEIDKTAQPFPGSDLDRLRQLLNEAAETWSPGHPALAGPPAAAGSPFPLASKDYALVPELLANRSNRITRIRTFFAEKTKDAKVKLRVVTDPKGADRSNTGGATADPSDNFLTVLFGRVQTVITYFTPSFKGDAAATHQQFSDQGDSSSRRFTVLTHEIGHAMGLMDEYYEVINPKILDPAALGLAHPFMPRFDQIDEGFSDYRPYYSDAPALMTNNALPRLRHFWHHAKNFQAVLNPSPAPPNFKPPPDQPYVLAHPNFNFRGGSGRDYKVPPDDRKAPWVADFVDAPIPGGRGRCALFPLGPDEGAIESMFQNPATFSGVGLNATDQMQGVLLVRSRLGFVFDASVAPPARLRQVFDDFHQKIYTANYSPKIRFVLVGAPTAKYPRIAVLFQPLYAVANDAAAKADLSGALDTSDIDDDADLVFDIAATATPPRPNPFLNNNLPTAQGTRVSCMKADFTFELAMRLVLGIDTALPGGAGPDLGVLRSTDLAKLVQLVQLRLAETLPRTVQIYP
jgi:hypothetical protein